MNGSPEDVEGECNARLYLGDDHGDGTCTCRCTLGLHHEGQHREKFNRGDEESPAEVTILWEKDESALCDVCGKRRETFTFLKIKGDDRRFCFDCWEAAGGTWEKDYDYDD